MLKLIKEHPLWTLYFAASGCYATATGLEEGLAAGFTSAGGALVLAIAIYFLANE